MSNPTNGHEIISPLKPDAGASKTPPTPNTKTPKKRKPNTTSDERLTKVLLIKKLVDEALEGITGKKRKTEITKVILAAHDMDYTQYTKWQQVCEICCSEHGPYNNAFACTNDKCHSHLCKNCVARDVIRILSNHSVYRHTFLFRCLSCQAPKASDLTLTKSTDEVRKEALIMAMLARIELLLKENEALLVPLMGDFCRFRFKMRKNFDFDCIKPFTEEEQNTICDFMILWKKHSGVHVDDNEFKLNQKQISMGIQWLGESYTVDVDGVLQHWTILNEKFDGWFEMMLEFGMKCHTRMMSISHRVDVDRYSFADGLRRISISVESIHIE